MMNLTKFFLFFLMTFNHSLLFAADLPCLSKKPATTDTDMRKEIREFFKGIEQWTEVKKEGSLEMTDHPPVVRIHVNFTDPMKTVVTEDKKAKRSLQQICKTANGFNIISKGITLKLDRTSHGIRSQFRIPLIGKIETYYYMPSSRVEGIQESELAIEQVTPSLAIRF